jgi:dihydropyrimidinase
MDGPIHLDPAGWQGRRIDDTTGGNAGVEPRLSLIYPETVEKRGYGLSDFVGLVSANAAKIMGLYPKKGALAVGAPTPTSWCSTRAAARPCAPPNCTKPITAHGRAATLAAWPSLVMLRGKIVVENLAWRRRKLLTIMADVFQH